MKTNLPKKKGKRVHTKKIEDKFIKEKEFTDRGTVFEEDEREQYPEIPDEQALPDTGEKKFEEKPGND